MAIDLASPSPRAGITLADVRNHREAILEIARRHGARDIAVFGSVARDEATATSDVDFLVHMEVGRSLLDVGGLLMDVRDLLGVPVDVATDAGMNERIRLRARRDAVSL